MLESHFDKAVSRKAWKIIGKALQSRYFLVSFSKSLRTLFYKTSPVAPSEVFLNDFVDNSCNNALLYILENSTCSFWLIKYFFPIDVYTLN